GLDFAAGGDDEEGVGEDFKGGGVEAVDEGAVEGLGGWGSLVGGGHGGHGGGGMFFLGGWRERS
ncbi:hypothetical protein BBP40_004959, partial [Aspergillus hancockii]